MVSRRLAFSWGDLMQALKVNNAERYSRLAVLALDADHCVREFGACSRTPEK
jgi:hypothetical protein